MYLRWINGSRMVRAWFLLSIMLQEGETVLTLTKSHTPECGGSVVLTCTRDSPLSSVTWYKNSVPIIASPPKYVENIPGGVSATLTISDIQNSDEGNYYCETGFSETSPTLTLNCSAPTTAVSTTTGAPTTESSTTTTTTTTTTTPATTTVTANTTTTTSSSGSTSFSAVPENSSNTDTTPTASPGKNADHIIVLIAVVSLVGGVFLLGIAGTIILLCRKRTRRMKHQENNGMTSERRSRDIQNQHVQTRTHHF